MSRGIDLITLIHADELTCLQLSLVPRGALLQSVRDLELLRLQIADLSWEMNHAVRYGRVVALTVLSYNATL